MKTAIPKGAFPSSLEDYAYGFSWAVFVAHEATAELLRRCLTETATTLSFSRRFVRLSKHSTYLLVAADDIAIGHIIDNVCAVGFEFEPDVLLGVQASIWSSFCRHGLPIKISKSTALGSLVTDQITFIGHVWNFSTGQLRTKVDRCKAVAALAAQSDEPYLNLDAKGFHSLGGKIIWMCVCHRPLLSTLGFAVLPIALESRSARVAAARELRQFGRLARLNIYRAMSTIVLNTDASEHPGPFCTVVRRRKTSMRYLSPLAIMAACCQEILDPLGTLLERGF